MLRPREDDSVATRLARSAEVRKSGAFLRTADFAEWLGARGRAHDFRVDRIPFADLDGWSFAPDTGNLVHRSGRFFTIEGLRVTRDEGPFREWQQPIIKQPEVGILGILAKEFDGVLHFLMQAKMEPGNRNLLQLSPTVQATRSNYTKAHQGADVKYIDHFIRPSGRRRVLADALQSEHGSWFYQKSNRNMIVETDEDIPVDEDFIWLTLGQIGELLHADNVVNMDARTVLACAPVAYDEPGALRSDTELLSWFTAERARHQVTAERIPLRDVAEWKRGDMAIEHGGGGYFQVVAVSVAADNREVTGWTQPPSSRWAWASPRSSPAAWTVCRTSSRTRAWRAGSSTPWSSARPSSTPRTTTRTWPAPAGRRTWRRCSPPIPRASATRRCTRRRAAAS